MAERGFLSHDKRGDIKNNAELNIKTSVTGLKSFLFFDIYTPRTPMHFGQRNSSTIIPYVFVLLLKVGLRYLRKNSVWASNANWMSIILCLVRGRFSLMATFIGIIKTNAIVLWPGFICCYETTKEILTVTSNRTQTKHSLEYWTRICYWSNDSMCGSHPYRRTLFDLFKFSVKTW